MISQISRFANQILSNTVKKAIPKRIQDRYALGIYAEKWLLPRDTISSAAETYKSEEMPFLDGLNYRIEEQINRLKRWRKDYHNFFSSIRNDEKINTMHFGQNYIHNGYYPTPDAEIYSAMILDFLPHDIIEIGSGYSTLIAKKTILEKGMNCRITVIDPSPRTDVTDVADTVINSLVENIDPGKLPITHGTILFIDSSHICRGFGDIPYLFCKIIPHLPPGVLVHVHDIFLPYEYPNVYLKMLYTEQYILYAMLSNTDKFEIIMSTHYLSRNYTNEMQQTFGNIVGVIPEYLGASLWFLTI